MSIRKLVCNKRANCRAILTGICLFDIEIRKVSACLRFPYAGTKGKINQREFWQRFNWPGSSDHPGASLSWISVRTGERLFGDYPGTWGLIRLLEQARVTPLNDGESRYRLVLDAPDGLGLTWHLRTELDAGPLALLKLRDFTLPGQIFLGENGAKTL